MKAAGDVALLEQFVLNNPELERLETILDEFNPFVAMKWTRQEIRHSCFLRWLLDPSETHGLGSYFLRQFVKHIASLANQPNGISVVDLDSWSYTTTQVQAEWECIDVLIRDDVHKLIVLIENKVDTSEHSDQLARYRKIVEREFPQHHKLLVYLTVENEGASDEGFIPLGYADVVRLVNDTIVRRHDQLHPSVTAFMKSYVEMLRRHIVEDSEIQTLCDKIYTRHRRALEILFEFQPDRVSEIQEFVLAELVRKVPQLQEDHSSKALIRFLPKSLDFLPRHGETWTASKRIILIEIDQRAGLKLKVILGPGRQETRDRLHAYIHKQSATFNRATTKYYTRWWSFHIEDWISKKEYEETDIDELKRLISSRFEKFVNGPLPEIVKVLDGLRKEKWD